MSIIYNTITSIKKKWHDIPDPSSTTFCYYPFFEILMTSDGKYKPCSKHHDCITHKGEILTTDKSGIMDAWNSDYMQNIRKKMLNNERHEGCAECWREEDNGVIPMRYDSYNYIIPRKQVESVKYPTKIEINASNICNIKCRICTSHASTKWMAEEKAVYGNAQSKYINLNEQNMQQIIDLLPHLEEIGLFGGEPLLSEENINLLRYCVKSGESKHIQLLINTNTTIYTDEIAELLPQFRKVYLNFSIDDIEKRFEYQRKGAKWNEVVENMKKYIALGGYSRFNKIECKICCTVTNMNIYYFPEYFAYMNKHFKGLPVFWNLLYNPTEFSIQILPKEIKETLRERLTTKINTTYKMESMRTKTVDTLLTYLDFEQPGNFKDFFTLVERHDKYRNEKFSEVFPEFWALIEKYKWQ